MSKARANREFLTIRCIPAAEAMALILHSLFPHRDVVAFHDRGYPPSTGRPSAQALFSDSLVIFDHSTRASVGGPILPVGFSIGAAVASTRSRRWPATGGLRSAPLLCNRMPTIEFVRGSNVPTAIIIAERDTIVPKPHSDALSAEIENLVFERAIDAGHNDLYDHPAFAKAAREALMRVEATSGESS